MKTTKRVLGILLVLALVYSLALPAAAASYTTILRDIGPSFFSSGGGFSLFLRILFLPLSILLSFLPNPLTLFFSFIFSHIF